MIIFEVDGYEFTATVYAREDDVPEGVRAVKFTAPDGTDYWLGAPVATPEPAEAQHTVELKPATASQHYVQVDGKTQGSLRLREGQWVAHLDDFDVPADLTWDTPAQALEALRDVLLER